MSETYKQYSLPDLWKSVVGEDAEAGFVHVNTLNRLRTALEQQRNSLRVHRDRLVEGWSPDRSDAAVAFVAQINGLIEVMTSTVAATGRICDGVDAAYAAVRDVRRELEPTLAEYSKRPAGAGLVVANVGNPQLDQQARDVFIAADAKIVKASALINSGLPEPLMLPDDTSEVVNADRPGSAGGGSSRAGAGAAGGTMQSAVLRAPVFNPPVPSGSDAGVVDVGGPVLASNPADWTSPTPQANFSGLIGGSPAVGSPRSVISPLVPQVLGPDGVIRAPSVSHGSAGQTNAMPMGGVAQRGVAGNVTRRPAVPRPELAAARGGVGTPGGYRDQSYETYVAGRRSRRVADDDELWPVDEGVPPVISAPPERRHEPGPGALGIDR